MNKKRVVILILISILVLLSLIGVADPSKLSSILATADISMILLAIVTYTITIFVFGLIWHFLLKAADLDLSLKNIQRLVFSSVFFNVVTPTASYGGEAIRVYLMSKKFNLDAGRGAATIVAHRIIGTLSNSFGTLALGVYLIIFYSVPKVLLAIIVVVTIASFFGFLIFLYFGFRIEWSKSFMERIFSLISRFRVVSEEFKDSFYTSLESYHEGLVILLQSKQALLISMLLGLLTWFLVNLVAVFSFKAVGGGITAENFVLIFTFFSVSRLIPTGLPEFVGSKEAIFAALYSVSGLPVSVSVAVALIIRIATQLWMILLGGAITLQLGVEGLGSKVKV
jgi:uncharacterized protein (TIRG00374 family)